MKRAGCGAIKSRGFTMVEMMVILGVIAILTTTYAVRGLRSFDK